MISVVIFDDHLARREGLSMLINSCANMRCIGAYPDCRNVVQNVKRTTPDVILMDIDMPIVNGLQGVQLLRAEATLKNVKILMQTVFEDNQNIFEALVSGADGYILKQASHLKLIEGITEVYEGGAPMTPIIARKVLQLLNQKSGIKITSEFNLTKREKQILSLLVEGLSYKMIASECGISYPTVNSHVSNIYEKLQVSSVASAVRLAIREGLV